VTPSALAGAVAASRARLIGAAVGLCLIGLGAVQIALAAHGPIKAWIGQQMLESAWSESRSAGTPVRPWAWADIRPVARISAPRLGVSAVVLDGTSGEAMAWGPGHVVGTAPIGQPGLAAIAGHRDSHLAFLAELRPGDAITVQPAEGPAQRYRVSEALVVDSRHWRFPVDRTGPARLALATCWPFDARDSGPLRFVLFAERAAPGA